MIYLWQNDQESRLLLLQMKNRTYKYNFNPQCRWLEEFSWLFFKEGAMFCKFSGLLEGMAGKSQFVLGTVILKGKQSRNTEICDAMPCAKTHIAHILRKASQTLQDWNVYCCFQQSRVPKQRRGSQTDGNYI